MPRPRCVCVCLQLLPLAYFKTISLTGWRNNFDENLIAFGRRQKYPLRREPVCVCACVRSRPPPLCVSRALWTFTLLYHSVSSTSSCFSRKSQHFPNCRCNKSPLLHLIMSLSISNPDILRIQILLSELLRHSRTAITENSRSFSPIKPQLFSSTSVLRVLIRPPNWLLERAISVEQRINSTL